MELNAEAESLREHEIYVDVDEQTILRESEAYADIDQRTVLRENFKRLVDHYGGQGRLTKALRWRALAYEVMSRRSEGEDVMKRSIGDLLEGMKAIIQLSGEDPESTFLLNFSGRRQVERLVEPMRQLADMIYIGFMTDIYEVRVEGAGVAYDSSRMKAWNSDTVHLGTDQAVTVACTLELGLCKRRVGFLSATDNLELQSESGVKDSSNAGTILLMPIVLL